jgi:hypothetical protein
MHGSVEVDAKSYYQYYRDLQRNDQNNAILFHDIRNKITTHVRRNINIRNALLSYCRSFNIVVIVLMREFKDHAWLFL